jgi:hypothetical protein
VATVGALVVATVALLEPAVDGFVLPLDVNVSDEAAGMSAPATVMMSTVVVDVAEIVVALGNPVTIVSDVPRAAPNAVTAVVPPSGVIIVTVMVSAMAILVDELNEIVRTTDVADLIPLLSVSDIPELTPDMTSEPPVSAVGDCDVLIVVAYVPEAGLVVAVTTNVMAVPAVTVDEPVNVMTRVSVDDVHAVDETDSDEKPVLVETDGAAASTPPLVVHVDMVSVIVSPPVNVAPVCVNVIVINAPDALGTVDEMDAVGVAVMVPPMVMSPLTVDLALVVAPQM